VSPSSLLHRDCYKWPLLSDSVSVWSDSFCLFAARLLYIAVASQVAYRFVLTIHSRSFWAKSNQRFLPQKRPVKTGQLKQSCVTKTTRLTPFGSQNFAVAIPMHPSFGQLQLASVLRRPTLFSSPSQNFSL